MDFSTQTIGGIRAAIQNRATTATAVVESCYNAISERDGQIGAFLTLCAERALARAARIDAMASAGETLPALAGVPVGIKDVLSTAGVKTTGGSKILGNYVPPYDATVVARLEQAGAIIVGKLNCDEF